MSVTRKMSYGEQIHGVSCIAFDCTFVTRGNSSRLEDCQILCVAAIADLTVRMVGDLSWSRQNIWPNGVRTNEDMNRFARLIVGPTASLEDYSQSGLPEDREDIFLFVSRGGCEQGTRLAELANCVPDMMEELVRHAVANGNTFRLA